MRGQKGNHVSIKNIHWKRNLFPLDQIPLRSLLVTFPARYLPPAAAEVCLVWPLARQLLAVPGLPKASSSGRLHMARSSLEKGQTGHASSEAGRRKQQRSSEVWWTEKRGKDWKKIRGWGQLSNPVVVNIYGVPNTLMILWSQGHCNSCNFKDWS